MGVRASMETLKLERSGALANQIWPATRTVLIRASDGVATQGVAEGASRAYDLEDWAPDVELHEVEGTHFGILNPDSGLSGILNEVFVA